MLGLDSCRAGDAGCEKSRLVDDAFESALDIAHPGVRSAAFMQIALQADARILRCFRKDEPRLGNDDRGPRARLRSATTFEGAACDCGPADRKDAAPVSAGRLMKLASRFSGNSREDFQQELDPRRLLDPVGRGLQAVGGG